MARLSGKVALVTGATSGIGLGIARAYVREGAKVVVNGRNADSIGATVTELTALGGDVLGARADVSSPSEVAAMFARAQERYGTVDILVNNAAYLNTDDRSLKARMAFMELQTQPVPKRSLGVTKDMTEEVWRNNLSANLDGVFYCTRAALRIMEERRYGKIVNVSSIAGISGLAAHNCAYAASKGGVVAFTKAVAIEVIGAGINVNCIAPGGFLTPPMEDALAKAPELDQRLRQLIPQGRLGTLEECASVAVFLASDEAAYLVGQVISPNGGVVV